MGTVLVVGTTFGVVARQSGLEPVQIAAMSLLVFAGASQFAMVRLFSERAPTAIVIASVLKGVRVAILATDGVEKVELTLPRLSLEEAGADTVLIAPKPQIQSMNHDEKDDRFVADMLLKDAQPEEFDAVMLPGGALNADKLRMETAARDIVQQIDSAGKPIAAICHAPWLLVSAKLVKGRRLTSYYTLQDDIRAREAGGRIRRSSSTRTG